MVEQEEEIPGQSEDQPFQENQELSQELSQPYALYENDTHYTIVIYTPCIISKNQLTIGVEYNKLLVIKGSFYANDESNRYGKLIRNSWPLGLDLKILLPTKVNPMDKVTVNIEQGLTKLFIKKTRIMLTIV